MSDGTQDNDFPVGLKLQREVSSYPQTGQALGFLMRVTVSDFWNIDPNVFVFSRETRLEIGAEPVYVFSHMASPAELEDLPVYSDDTTEDLVRGAAWEFVFESMDLLEETWDILVALQKELVRTMVSFGKLAIDAVSTVGLFLGSSSSEGGTVLPLQGARYREGNVEIYNPVTERWYKLVMVGADGEEVLGTEGT